MHYDNNEHVLKVARLSILGEYIDIHGELWMYFLFSFCRKDSRITKHKLKRAPKEALSCRNESDAQYGLPVGFF